MADVAGEIDELADVGLPHDTAAVGTAHDRSLSIARPAFLLADVFGNDGADRLIIIRHLAPFGRDLHAAHHAFDNAGDLAGGNDMIDRCRRDRPVGHARYFGIVRTLDDHRSAMRVNGDRAGGAVAAIPGQDDRDAS